MKQNYRILDLVSGLYHSVLCTAADLAGKAEKIGVVDFETMTEAEYEDTQHHADLARADAKAEANAPHLAYLARTDWYVIRLLESATAVPDDVLIARIEAREAIV